MQVQLDYRYRSGVIDSSSSRGIMGQTLLLSPNLAREPVAFDAPILQPIRFREAISALHDVNEQKTRVQRRHVRQAVTGVVVNEKVNAPRDLIRRLRSILHHARTEGLSAQNREHVPHFESWVTGMIAYISMLNPQQGKRCGPRTSNWRRNRVQVTVDAAGSAG